MEAARSHFISLFLLAIAFSSFLAPSQGHLWSDPLSIDVSNEASPLSQLSHRLLLKARTLLQFLPGGLPATVATGTPLKRRDVPQIRPANTALGALAPAPGKAAMAPTGKAQAPTGKALAPVAQAPAPTGKAQAPTGAKTLVRRAGGPLTAYNTAGCTLVVGAPGGIKSIQQALNRLGPNPIRAGRKVICILPGTYKERVKVSANQHMITFRGFNRQSTLIVARAWQQDKSMDPAAQATLIVDGHLFQAQNITVENAHRNITTPSPAVSINGRRSTWRNVAIIAWCDTLYTSTSNHLFVDSLVGGLTDMIWGYGRCAFVNCNIFIRFWYDPNIVYTGHVATFGTEYTSFGITGGAVFYKCKIYGPGLTKLGQAYRADVIVVYDSCWMGPAVAPQGWGNLFNMFQRGKSRFLEFNSVGPGARFGQRQYGRAIRGKAPFPLTVQGFIGRTAE